jgi:outer membrane lipoprotein carrier protein
MWAIFLVVLQAAAAPAPKQLVERMQRFYERTVDFKAEFRQTQSNPIMGRKQIYDGVVRFKKPGKMRWDYQSPEKKLFVSDGKVLWMYEPEDAQAYRQPLSDSALPGAVAFLFGQGNLARDFEISQVGGDDAKDYGAPGDPILRLTPRAATAQYKSIVLDLDPTSFQVKQSFVFQTQGNVNQVTFRKVELNTKIPDGVFSWSPPTGTKIVKP